MLGVEHGLVALTKCDLVDDELLELARAEAEEIVPGAPVIATSARTGRGLDELRSSLATIARRATPKVDAPSRLYVDRVFTLRGIGTIATGTLWSGSVGSGDILRVEPGGRSVRVRSVQVHDRPSERADAGQRVAVALTGVERAELRRGDVLITPGSSRPATAWISPWRSLVTCRPRPCPPWHRRRTRPSGPSRRPTRPAPSQQTGGRRARGPTDLACWDHGWGWPGDRSAATAPFRPERMQRIEAGDVAATIYAPVRESQLSHVLDGPLEGVRRAGDWAFSGRWLTELRSQLEQRLDEVDSIDPGIPALRALGR